MDHFFPNTPASPLIPGRFLTCNRARSSWLGYKFGCVAWNFFYLKGFPVAFQTANISFLFWIKDCLFLWGSNSRRGDGVNSNGHCIDIFNRRGYQGCVSHVFQNLTYQTKRGESIWKHFVPTLLHSICCYAVWIGLPFYV